MNNYKLIIQYEGTKYNGWQKQIKTENTIQGKLENIISKMLGENIELHGSGRTDAGVHAYAQVANFWADTDMTPQEIRNYINVYLPKDIAVISVELAASRFHSRLNAKKKTYVYRIHNSDIPNVFERNFMYFYPQKLDVELMKKASIHFIGEHDFKAFCSNKNFKKSTVRTIYSIDIIQNGEEIRIIYTGNGFLYNMVRIITGTLIEIGAGKRKEDEIDYIIQSKIRENAGFTVPPEGLALLNVEY